MAPWNLSPWDNRQLASAPAALAVLDPMPVVGAEAGAAPAQCLVIIGNGMVGHRLCERLTEESREGRFRIVVFAEEPRPAYDRVRLTEMLVGGSAQALELHDQAWYARRAIELVLDDPVLAVDRARRMVRSRSGREQHYDHLVFATGAAPLVPPIEGLDQPGVFVYRTISDLQQIAAWSAGRARAAVVGGGLLGLEAARALRKLGLEVRVLEAAPHLMPSQLDGEGGALLARRVEALGIGVSTSARLQRIVSQGQRLGLELAGRDAPLEADLVVVSAGIRPRDKLAAYAGLPCGSRGGISVDEHLQTADPRVYAVGDCAAYRGTVTGLVAPGYRMADVLARNLLGESVRFDGGDRSTRLKLLEIEVASLGDLHADGAMVVHRSADRYRKLLLKRGRIAGAMAVGPWPELPEVERRISARARLWPWQARRFRRSGQLGDPAPHPVLRWPATAVVCNCFGVTRGALAKALLRGCGTVQALTAATGAGAGCGSCQVHLAALVGEPPPAGRSPGRRVLAGATGGALLALGGWLITRPVAMSTSVQGGWHLDVLWRSGVARQVTGFTLLGLMLVALLLSLRKRWRRLGRGPLGWWRAVHALVGALSVIALAAHTGMRGGHNLNRILVSSFLAVLLTGAAAGAAFAAGDRPSAAGRRWQQGARLAHVASWWPLPPLLAFHVLAAYWF